MVSHGGTGSARQTEEQLAAVYGMSVDTGHWVAVVARKAGRASCTSQRSRRRRRSAFEMTETDDRLIAAAAIIGESSNPMTG